MQMFADDMQDVAGATLSKYSSNAKIRIVQIDKDKSAISELRLAGIDTDKLLQKKDAFCIRVYDGQLIVAGSNGRGTAYGILELSRLAGVSPWKWWADEMPQKRNRLTLPADYHSFQSPSVEYRGIFLNDEDWTTQPWSWRTFSPISDTTIMASAGAECKHVHHVSSQFP